jgi:hypothetical protein
MADIQLMLPFLGLNHHWKTTSAVEHCFQQHNWLYIKKYQDISLISIEPKKCSMRSLSECVGVNKSL